jgi:hypothetical protein
MTQLDKPNRVTPERIQEVIKECDYFNHGLLTVCIMTLANGFIVTGESACVSEANYNEELGQKIAREKATDKIWALEGYLLKQQADDEH